MDVRCKLDRLITQICHLPRVIQRAFERAADFGLVRFWLGELLTSVVEGTQNLALVWGLQLFEDLSEFGEFCVDIDGIGSRRRLISKFGVEFRIDRVAAPGDDDAARYLAGMDLIALRHRYLQQW